MGPPKQKERTAFKLMFVGVLPLEPVRQRTDSNRRCGPLSTRRPAPDLRTRAQPRPRREHPTVLRGVVAPNIHGSRLLTTCHDAAPAELR